MTDDPTTPAPTTIPPDDPTRRLTVARPDSGQNLPHIGLVGDTYTILVGGDDTNGRYTLIDMHVPPGGGPPPHRHDFEEMFTVLDGEVEATFRGQTLTLRAGETINVPANAPHAFRNVGEQPSRLLCLCAPAGQDEFFTSSASPWRPAPNRHHPSTQPDRPPSSPKRNRWPCATARSCCHHPGRPDELHSRPRRGGHPAGHGRAERPPAGHAAGR